MKYPIGIQTFEKIREEGMTYIDKTDLVYKLVYGTKYNFLSRPRRFGKSLLVTTLQSFFEGKKELFKGLAIEKLEKDWGKYSVIHLDFSSGKYYEYQRLLSTLDNILSPYEKLFGIVPKDNTAFGDRLNNIIRSAVEQNGKQAVILIDEYDAPMLDSITNEELQSKIRNVMRDFFSPLKANEGNLRFVFLTGITKFSQLSIFSELNNINNISMKDEFAAICGFTKQEILDNFHDGIEQMAVANKMTFDAVVDKLRMRYDGYHFSPNCPDLYNPYSLLNALYDKAFDSYWFGSGTPTFLVELMQKNNMLMPDLENIIATKDQFDAPTEHISDPVPVLYQSGYITIKHYEYGMYTLALPNEEVREGFNTFTLNYIAPTYGRQRTLFGYNFGNAMRRGDVDAAMQALRVFLAGFPYDIHHNREDYFQAILYTIFVTINFTIRAEVKTAKGRIDLLVTTKDYIYVMELKLDHSVEEALKQIDDKDYALPYKNDGRKIIKIGISFSSKERNITDWKVERENA